MRYRFIRFPEGREKALTLSYDDGCKFDIQLVEILNRYGIKTTLNVNSGIMGNTEEDWRLPAKTIQELASSGGHEIAVHGAQHIALGKASTAEGIRDILTCRETLEKEYNTIIRGMAYSDSGITEFTSGVTYEEIKQYLKSLGIAYARSLGGDNDRFLLPEDFYAWIPTAHHVNPKLFEYLDKFLEIEIHSYRANRYPFLFYMWGHSYEFDRNNNWELLEKFCERASGHKEIWYATNIEICDYVNAYRSLQFSVDGTRVFNPTCMAVWFEADGKTVCVHAGEEIKI